MSFLTVLLIAAAAAFSQTAAAPQTAPAQRLPPAVVLPAPPAWEKLKAAYDYKPAANSPAPTLAARDDADYLLQHVSLTDADGKIIPGLFLRPKAAGVYPVALLLHGLGGEKETMLRAFGRPLAAKGIACLALDAREHGERKPAGDARPPDGVRFAAVMRATVGDYRLALDYLKTRADVDSSRVGLLGYSMGAMMGSILAGVDERVRAIVLEVGGDPIRPFLLTLPEPAREMVEFVSTSNYVSHITPRPLLMINAEGDQTIKEDAARRLHDAARAPKEIFWAEGGHILAPADAQKGVGWLAEKLTGKK